MHLPTVAEDEFAALVEGGEERRDLEFKPGFTWGLQSNLEPQEKLIQTILGMTNTRGGGVVIMGIHEKVDPVKKYKTKLYEGLDPSTIEGFYNVEGIKGIIDGYASIATSFDVRHGRHKKKDFVVIRVQEFIEEPVICSKPGKVYSAGQPRILDVGCIYSRSIKAPYSTQKAGVHEMREIIRLAASKLRSDMASLGWQPPPHVLDYYRSLKEKI